MNLERLERLRQAQRGEQSVAQAELGGKKDDGVGRCPWVHPTHTRTQAGLNQAEALGLGPPGLVQGG